MVRNNIAKIEGLLKAKKALDTLCANTFTTKEYNAIRGKRSTNVHSLVKMGILSIDHIDEFELEVEIPIYRRGRKYVLVNDNGQAIDGIDIDSYYRMDKAVRLAIDNFYNNGNPLHQHMICYDGDTETITAKRYHYVYNRQKMIDRLHHEEQHLNKVVTRKYELFAKARRAYENAYNIQNNVAACLKAL